MADFNLAIGRTLLNEDSDLSGAVVVDNGSPNRWGIRQADFPSVDVPNLSLQVAVALYQATYWDKLGLSRLKPQTVAGKVFDLAVNMGGEAAAEVLQAALCGVYSRPVAIDGALGPLTVFAANACIEKILLDAVKREAAERYRKIASNDPALGKYLSGWLARAAQ